LGDQTTLTLSIMFGWLTVVVALYRLLGPRLATLAAVLGGCLFLVNVQVETPLPLRIQVLKNTVTGAGILLGVLVFDRQALRGARPRWSDAPMIAYAVLPMFGLLSAGWVGASDAVDEVLQRTLCWVVPYGAGRLYFGGDDGPRAVGAGVVVATLCLVPVCLFETIMGPRWYLSGLVYGTHFVPFMVERLGGWRPEGFFNDGIALATWMALGSSVAFWMWLGRGWRLGRSPAWLPPAVLVATTIACRGVYGYIGLAIGLVATLLTQMLRTRWVICAVALIAPVYIALRVSGQWDARALVAAGERLVPGRGGTVLVRLESEDQVIVQVLGRNSVLGFGNHMWNPGEVHATFKAHWPDGWWLKVFWGGGALGLAAHLAALHLVPIGLALSRPPGRPDREEAGATAWGLALFSAVYMIDSLHNASQFMPAVLAAGSIVGWSLDRRPGRPRTAPEAGKSHEGRGTESRDRAGRPMAAGSDPGRSGAPTSQVAVVAALACLLYVFGHGPVPGHEAVKLVGGLGAALLFAAAGATGAWAARRASLTRLAVYSILFAALGVSFNLALHPGHRSFAAADFLQGLAICGFAVAVVRRAVDGNVWADSVLALTPLAVHLLLRPYLPGFPGSQYLFAGQGGGYGLSLFPLCPWLTVAVLGARAARESVGVNLASAAFFGVAACYLARTDPGGDGFAKFPMNLPYALLSCAAVGVAFALARAVNVWTPSAGGARWLGHRWLVFFYVHFAVVEALRAAGLVSTWTVWALLAAASVAGTWLVARALGPFFRRFQSAAPWAILLGVIALAGVIPDLPRPVVSGIAGLAGLVFAAHYGTLAVCVANARRGNPRGFTRPPPPGTRPDRGDDSGSERAPAGGPGLAWRGESLSGTDRVRNLARLLLVLALLAVPEALEAISKRLGVSRGGSPSGGRNPSPPSPRPGGVPMLPSPDPRGPRPRPGDGPSPGSGRGSTAPPPPRPLGQNRLGWIGGLGSNGSFEGNHKGLPWDARGPAG